MAKVTDQDIVIAARELQTARFAHEAAVEAEFRAQIALSVRGKALREAAEALRRARERFDHLLDCDHLASMAA